MINFSAAGRFFKDASVKVFVQWDYILNCIIMKWKERDRVLKSVIINWPQGKKDQGIKDDSDTELEWLEKKKY